MRCPSVLTQIPRPSLRGTGPPFPGLGGNGPVRPSGEIEPGPPHCLSAPTLATDNAPRGSQRPEWGPLGGSVHSGASVALCSHRQSRMQSAGGCQKVSSPDERASVTHRHRAALCAGAGRTGRSGRGWLGAPQAPSMGTQRPLPRGRGEAAVQALTGPEATRLCRPTAASKSGPFPGQLGRALKVAWEAYPATPESAMTADLSLPVPLPLDQEDCSSWAAGRCPCGLTAWSLSTDPAVLEPGYPGPEQRRLGSSLLSLPPAIDTQLGPQLDAQP